MIRLLVDYWEDLLLELSERHLHRSLKAQVLKDSFNVIMDCVHLWAHLFQEIIKASWIYHLRFPLSYYLERLVDVGLRGS